MGFIYARRFVEKIWIGQLIIFIYKTKLRLIFLMILFPYQRDSCFLLSVRQNNDSNFKNLFAFRNLKKLLDNFVIVHKSTIPANNLFLIKEFPRREHIRLQCFLSSKLKITVSCTANANDWFSLWYFNFFPKQSFIKRFIQREITSFQKSKLHDPN